MNDILLYERVPALEKNFPVKIRLQSSSSFLFTHWHEHLEMLYLTDGDFEFVCNGKHLHAKQGDLVIVNSNEIHSFTSESKPTYFYLLIAPSFFSDVNFDNVLLENHIKGDEYVGKLIGEMYSEYEHGSEGNDLQIKGLAYTLMAYLVRSFTVEKLSDREYKLRRARHKRINTILEYISEHYQESITTSQLAADSYLSESYLCRFFKEAVGISITNYINELRVEKAAILLTNTDESITSVAGNVGFEDINYFSRVFKKIKRQTPREYRNKNK